jgi:hypothetical protein
VLALSHVGFVANTQNICVLRKVVNFWSEEQTSSQKSSKRKEKLDTKLPTDQPFITMNIIIITIKEAHHHEGRE